MSNHSRLSTGVVIALSLLLTSPCGMAEESDPRPEECGDGNAVPREMAYICAGSDLVDADYFARARQTQTDIKVEPSVNQSPARDVVEQKTGLSGEPRPNTGTAYIAKNWVWRNGDHGAQWDGKHLMIPVCWINTTGEKKEKRARNLVQQAVKATWESVSHIRFDGWTKCAAGETGGVRIKIADTGAKAYVGRYGGTRPVTMWLNFTFGNWSTPCANTDPKRGKILWEFCVYSIAVHEFGHVLGFFHEHDRLFHEVKFHGLSSVQLAARKADCAKRDQTKPTTTKLPEDAVSTVYDPKSVMNYCFEIYDHRAMLSGYDIAGLNKAYKKPN